MGYSRNKKAVHRLAKILDLLVEQEKSGAKLVKLPSSNPNELAYAIRNALFVVKEYEVEFAKYKSIGDTFKISQDRDYVLATRRSYVLAGDPVVELAKSLERLTLNDVFSLFEVAGAIMEYKAPELEFPAALLTDEDIESIKSLCKSDGHEIINFNPLTVRKNSGGPSDDATERGVVNS